MKLTYTLEETGWARAKIADGGQSLNMRVSYLSDVLSELIQAAIDMAEGNESSRCPFPDEPGGHMCFISRTGKDRILLRVMWHRDWWTPGGQKPTAGEEVFTCACPSEEFSREVFKCCKGVLDQYGEEGYKERWCANGFPTEKFEYLSRLLFPPRKVSKG